MYARVTRMLGDRRVSCFCNDGMERICKIRGTFCRGSKKHRIVIDDIVVISFRGDASSTADIVEWIASQDYREVKKHIGIHRNLFGSTMASTDGLDDLFENDES
jgi:translation initiation factor 1A